MRAVSCHDAALAVVEVPEPKPGPKQVLLDVVRCGICGSDLHARDHSDLLAEVMVELGYDHAMRGSTPTVLGHEIVGTVRESRRGARKELRDGALVAVYPLLRAAGGVHPIGLSPLAPGGYAERVLAEQSLCFVVPNGLAPDLAALTEPMAVALHAVNRGEVTKRDVAVVLGCGPVGLAVICWLKARGVRAIVASDPSPARRTVAMRCGADVVVDPREESPYDASPRRHTTTASELLERVVGSMEKLHRVPGWHGVFRAADRLGLTDGNGPVIFECVGRPGIIESAVTEAPLGSRMVVVGVCMGSDAFRPALAVNKALDLRFVLGYSPLEFRDALLALAEGQVYGGSLVTGTVGLDGVAAAFDALSDSANGAGAHAKILIDPALQGG